MTSALRAYVRRGSSREVRDIIVVVASTAAANLVLFLFLAVTARVLPPEDFGLFSSLFGIVVFVGIVVTALQTSVAARVAGVDPGMQMQMRDELTSGALRATGVGLVVLLAVSPLVARLLHVNDVAPVLSAGLVAILLVPWSIVLGVLQGQRRFRTMSGLTLIQALARSSALAVLVFTSDLTALFGAVALSAAASLVFGWFVVTSGGRRSVGRWRGVTRPRLTAGRGAFGWALVTVVAVTFPTVGDIAIVRHVYPAADAGLFAAVALVGRCVLFLPVGVNAVLFPRYVATPSERARRVLRNQGLLVTGVMCGLTAGVLAIDPVRTLDVIAGPGYSDGAEILRPYLLAVVAFGVASTYAYHQLASGSPRFALTVLVPHIAVYALLPFVFDTDLWTLTLGMALVATSLVVVSTFLPTAGRRS